VYQFLESLLFRITDLINVLNQEYPKLTQLNHHRMHHVFNVKSAKATKLTEGLLVVVDGQGVRCGLFVDDLLGQQQVGITPFS
jgi:chemotaxis protein histidine kinase CheA